MTTLLLTAFEPFNGASSNASMAVASQLCQEQPIAGVELHWSLLPVERYACLDRLRQALAEVEPCMVLAMGLAASRDRISIERIAINIDDFPIPDNAGNQVTDQPIISSGPLAYASTLPIKAMLASLQRAKIPAEISYSAGSYVCNHLFYGMQHLLATCDIRSGFIHLPPLEGKGLNLDTQCRALKLMIEAGLTQPEDITLENVGRIAGRTD